MRLGIPYQTPEAGLRRESASTMGVLAQVRGVGTDAPSRFALALLSRMRFRGACPALLESKRLLRQSSTDSFHAPREELDSTSRALGCQ